MNECEASRTIDAASGDLWGRIVAAKGKSVMYGRGPLPRRVVDRDVLARRPPAAAGVWSNRPGARHGVRLPADRREVRRRPRWTILPRRSGSEASRPRSTTMSTGSGRPMQAIARYKAEDLKSAIIVVGHSAGGDSAIRFAIWLKRAGVPVNLIVTLDPTRIAGRVPSNVERFVNIYCSMNTFGGGDPKPAADFHGHFASVDLKNFRRWHLELPETAGLQDAVVDKIMAVVEQPAVPEASGGPDRISDPARGADRAVGFRRGGRRGSRRHRQRSIAAQYGVPIWAVAAINGIDPDTPPARRAARGRAAYVRGRQILRTNDGLASRPGAQPVPSAPAPQTSAQMCLAPARAGSPWRSAASEAAPERSAAMPISNHSQRRGLLHLLVARPARSRRRSCGRCRS